MSFFRHVLQKDRLGTEHASLNSYHDAVKQTAKRNDTDIPIEFSLVVVLSPNSTQKQRQETSSNISILLGKKLRGFGKGFYNCFGGKLERSLHEHLYPARGAVRELQEETGVHIPLSVMEDGYVGTLNFTFDDWEVNRAMKVYLYCMVVSFSAEEDRANTTHERDEQADITIDPNQIRGCEEIEPKWFNNVYEIPLNQMFADDSLWLTMLLKHYDDKFGSLNNKVQPSATLNDEYPNQSKFMFDGWFHFASGGADTNKILHHYLKPKHPGIVLCFSSAPPPPVVKYTLEKQLFHALHLNHIHSPSIKEFKENYAMVNAIRKYLGSEERMEYVIDVAGGHGALAALFLVLTKKCHNAIVIDPAVVNGKEGILQAWSPFWNGDNNGAGRGKSLRYRHECLRIGLRDELDKILKRQTHDGTGSLVSPTSVLVVACHACQHLTDETMQIASEYGVNVACMPCCQKDHDGWWKRSAKQMGLSIGAMMDLLSAGKMMAWQTGSKAGVRYQVKMKLIDEKISPLQNRIILCKAIKRDGQEYAKTKLAHEKLAKAYRRAHRSTAFDSITEAKELDKAEVLQSQEHSSNSSMHNEKANRFHFASLMTGFCIGMAFTFILASKLRR